MSQLGLKRVNAKKENLQPLQTTEGFCSHSQDRSAGREVGIGTEDHGTE